MGFWNKPFKATRGFVNKVVREVDRVVMPSYQFQREYGTPQPAPQPAPQPQVIEEKAETDVEFPQYLKRNRLGLMIPLPEHYPTHVLKFVIGRYDQSTMSQFKDEFNTELFQKHKGLPYHEYIEKTINELRQKWNFGYIKAETKRIYP